MARSLNNTDMLAEARAAQWQPDTFLGAGNVRAIAPAKVNLFLGIGEKLPNGYHVATNVMHALALHDVVWMNCEPAHDAEVEGFAKPNSSATAIGGPSENLQVTITMVDKTGGCLSSSPDALAALPAIDNLAFKALDALARKLGRTQFERINIHIEKHVPAQAGLGGGSADAAAALKAAAHFWELPEDDKTVKHVAMELGADVAFFLQGACAVFTGVGEKFEHELTAWNLPVVLVKPEVGVPTAQAYEEFDRNPVHVPAQDEARVMNASAASEIPLFNNLQEAAARVQPELKAVRDWLQNVSRETFANRGSFDEAEIPQIGKPLLCGSGAATFMICETFAQATEIATLAGKQGWWARATTFSKLRSTVIGGKGGAK